MQIRMFCCLFKIRFQEATLDNHHSWILHFVISENRTFSIIHLKLLKLKRNSLCTFTKNCQNISPVFSLNVADNVGLSAFYTTIALLFEEGDKKRMQNFNRITSA
jgi:hypothetical protein